jgi:hypothetical protein
VLLIVVHVLEVDLVGADPVEAPAEAEAAEVLEEVVDLVLL